MNLADFIEQRQAVLLETFIANVRAHTLNPEADTPRSVIENAIPAFLLELIDRLRAARPIDPQVESDASEEHGEQRYENGFDLDSVIREYSVLAHVILREVELAGIVVSVREFDCLVNALNGGVANAVSAYVRTQNAEREDLLGRERAARVEAEKLGQFKDEFLATLSHELRTPLQAILGYASALLGNARDADAVERGLAVIERNSRALTDLIERLLDMSALKAGRVRLRVEDVCLAEVVEATLATLERAAAARSIRCEVLCNDARATFPGDRERVGQIAYQLLTNAIRSSKQGGVVRAEIDCGADVVALRVSDDGTSGDTANLPYAFDMFAPQNTHTRRTADGLGIGLAFIKELVELHGGEVFAMPNPAGAGATFVAAFPRTVKTAGAVESARPAPNTERSGDSVLESKNVLVIDDEEDARDLMAMLLTRHGARVVTAGSAPEAIALLAAEDIDLMISDVGLPGMDGLTLMQQLRSDGDERLAKIPSIALTAFASPKDGERAMAAGFDLYLAKPADAKSVIEAVTKLKAKKRR